MAELNSKFQDWSRDELINEITRLTKDKKFGLVWEEKEDEVVEKCKTKFPVWDEVKDKEICLDPTKPTNILIEGDNYHTLSVLSYTHKGKVDFIYIDPPYNTGNKSWKYNNKFVDKEDGFRHSKWLSFISKRLELSKHLLKKCGMIVVTIDDYEIGPLRLLMDEIFGEQNRLGLVTIMHNPGGRSDDQYFATSHEYCLVYGKYHGETATYKLPLSEEQKSNYNYKDEISFYKLAQFRRGGSNSTPKERPNLFYPIYYNSNTGDISISKRENYEEILPLDNQGNKRVWRWSKETLKQRKNTEIIVKNTKGKISIYTKDRIKEGRTPKTVWVDPKYDASSHGTKLLQKILGKRNAFDYPKSLYAVKDMLEIGVQGKKDAIILDFFAGSGTTGHAVLELNKEDGGNRKFILSTNNEDNNKEGSKIAPDICYPRLKKVIEGYKSGNDCFEGLGGNLKYYRTSYIPALITDKNKLMLAEKLIEILCVREETYQLVTTASTKGFKLYKGHSSYTGILFDLLEISNFKKTITEIDFPFRVYVFSLGGDSFIEEFSDVSDKVTLLPLPEGILRVYKRLFQL